MDHIESHCTGRETKKPEGEHSYQITSKTTWHI